MIEQDTIKLLRECDAGVKMGVASIDDVLPHVKSSALEKYLTDCKKNTRSSAAKYKSCWINIMMMAKNQTLLQRECRG